MKCRRRALVQPLEQLEGFEGFVSKFQKSGQGKIVGTVDACKGHMIYGLSSILERTPVIITEDDVSAKNFMKISSFSMTIRKYISTQLEIYSFIMQMCTVWTLQRSV